MRCLEPPQLPGLPLPGDPSVGRTWWSVRLICMCSWHIFYTWKRVEHWKVCTLLRRENGMKQNIGLCNWKCLMTLRDRWDSLPSCTVWPHSVIVHRNISMSRGGGHLQMVPQKLHKLTAQDKIHLKMGFNCRGALRRKCQNVCVSVCVVPCLDGS